MAFASFHNCDRSLTTDREVYLTEASDLGLRPGEWPDWIETVIGDGSDFVVMPASESGLQGGGRWYQQDSTGIKLYVSND